MGIDQTKYILVFKQRESSILYRRTSKRAKGKVCLMKQGLYIRRNLVPVAALHICRERDPLGYSAPPNKGYIDDLSGAQIRRRPLKGDSFNV
jgi:hypothetical protein